MLGAVIGDIIGSIYERNNIKTKSFELWNKKCRFTDDTVMTIAVGMALIDSKSKSGEFAKCLIKRLKEYGEAYPNVGYGKMFKEWIKQDYPAPYNSFGNGAAMRASACGFFAESLGEAEHLGKVSAEVTHNHPDGIDGAQAVSAAIFLAKTGHGKEEIKAYINDKFYSITQSLDEIRKDYYFRVSCRGTVPQAIQAFLESSSFEDAIRNAISIGGDSDTIAAITGGIAEAFYRISDEIRDVGLSYLDEKLRSDILYIEKTYRRKSEERKV